MKILLAEDEVSLARALIRILGKSHYSVEVVYNGMDALRYLENGEYDAVILDVMMPCMDGISVLKEIREQGNKVPVIMLTAKTEIDDKVLGLDSGANDYLTKPFDAKELLARIRAMTRGQNTTDSRMTFGNITLDRATFMLSSPCGNFTLANKEFQMMEILLSNPRQIVSTERFLEKIWGYDAEAQVNVVWVYISYLRKKLNVLHADIQIKSARNAGYSLEEI